MKTAIVYYSGHHGNTRLLVNAIADEFEMDLIDIILSPNADISSYDVIGFASGIYMSRFHKSILRFIRSSLPEGKKVFFLYTYGSKNSAYDQQVRAAALEHNAQILGSFGCRGYDTFGPFGLIGGIAKGHPNQADLSSAIQFYADHVDKAVSI